MERQAERSLTPGAVFGLSLVGTVLVLSVMAGGLVVAWASKKGADARKGWTLVQVTVAARDLDEGTVLADADVATAAFPEQFATASVVTAATLPRVRGRALAVPLRQGAVLLHSHVTPRPPSTGCALAVRELSGKVPGLPEPQREAFLDALAAAEAEAAR